MARTNGKAFLVLAAGAFAVTGCAQIGSVAGDVWGGTKQVASWVASPVTSLLRDTPDTEYAFAANDEGGDADTAVTFASTTSPYAGGTVELYDTSAFADAPHGISQSSGTYAVAEAAAPISAEPVQSISFVRLDGGPLSFSDWQSCEASSGGYWSVDAQGGRMNPKFEVCMRNKTYVLETERASYASGDRLAGGFSSQP
ncbi:MAG: hypothetical protein WBF53_10045 [Litorimonas sp.]